MSVYRMDRNQSAWVRRAAELNSIFLLVGRGVTRVSHVFTHYWHKPSVDHKPQASFAYIAVTALEIESKSFPPKQRLSPCIIKKSLLVDCHGISVMVLLQHSQRSLTNLFLPRDK